MKGFTVALIGPDGAGKTTVARELERTLARPARYLYMGVNRDASTHMLPTTRLVRAVKRWRGVAPDTGGPPDSRAPAAPPPKTRAERVARAARAAARLTNQVAEESYRELLAWWWTRRGTIVLFDRHFFSDFHAYDVGGSTNKPLDRRIHGLVLSRLARKPDLVVYLDAPADVLLARKGEGTLELLERRRGEYLALARELPAFVVVDATRPLEQVRDEAAGLIERYGSRADRATA